MLLLVAWLQCAPFIDIKNNVSPSYLLSINKWMHIYSFILFHFLHFNLIYIYYILIYLNTYICVTIQTIFSAESLSSLAAAGYFAIRQFSVWFLIKRKTVTTIVFLSIWNELKKNCECGDGIALLKERKQKKFIMCINLWNAWYNDIQKLFSSLLKKK